MANENFNPTLSTDEVWRGTNSNRCLTDDLDILGIEDANHSGCYYRTVNGVTEWINPPMIVGTEYRTTKRCDGKTVYVKRINFGALPNNTVKSVDAFNGEWYRVVELKGMMVDSTNTWLVEPLPNSQVRLFGHNEYVKIQTSSNMSSYTAYVDINYTKD